MENKLVPKLRFPGFEEEWEIRALGTLLNFKNGVNASKENYGFGYKFINVLDIIKNNIILHDNIIGEVNISEKEFEKNIVKYGDILFQRSSETRDEVGQSNVYLDEDTPATFGGFVIRGSKIAEIDSLYLHFLLKTKKARKEITTKSGGSTRYNVGQETLSNVNIINSTSLSEQQKIADYLSTIDKKITLLEEKKEELLHYKKAMMQKLFSQEIRFKPDGSLLFDKLRVTAPDDCSAELVDCHLFDKLRVTTTPVEADEQRVTTKPDDCPAELVDCHLFDKLRETAQDDCPAELVEAHNHTVTSNAVDLYPDWDYVQLKDILIEHKEKNKGNKYSEVLSVAKEKGVINQIEHLGRSYAAENIEHYKVINPFDVVYTKSPTSGFPFGIIKQNKLGRSGVLSPLYAVFKPKTKYLGMILHDLFLSEVETYNYLVPLVQKGAKNTMNINNDDFLNGRKYFLPSDIKEQQKIADFLSAIDSSIDKVKEQIEQTQAFKKAMLQQMFV